MLAGLIALAAECGIGYVTWHWLMTAGFPARYVAPRVAAPISDVPLTLDTDWRGLV